MSKRVLVVDDEKLIVKGIRFSLEQDGMEVDAAYDGEEALAMARENEYDIILLDHMMPGMDGVDTLHQMQKMECFIQEPSVVIALTANAVIGAKEGYLKEGFTDYLSKPIDYVKLEDMIRKYLPEGMCEMNS